MASCFSCCFRRIDADADADYPAQAPTATLIRSSTDWVRSRAADLPDRCRGIVSRISRTGRHHRRHASADFGYDPLSYALNFDEGLDLDVEADHSLEDIRFRNFSSRLPASPPQPPADLR